MAKCEFGGCEDWDGTLYGVDSVSDLGGVPYKPSTDWAQAGPIIEREFINIFNQTNGYRGATMMATDQNPHPGPYFGETILIAAMRCYVASKLGDTVEVPDELIEQEEKA